MRQLLDSLSREQRRNQELLSSLGFALRSFTNLGRFLELVPLVASRLVEAEGAVLITFHPDGRLWREQLHGGPPELLRALASLSDEELLQASGDEAVALLREVLDADDVAGCDAEYGGQPRELIERIDAFLAGLS